MNASSEKGSRGGGEHEVRWSPVLGSGGVGDWPTSTSCRRA